MEEIFVAVAGAAGSFAQETAESFNSARWAPFLDFLADEAPGALTTLGQTVGSLAHGLAELWMAFQPTNNDFATWMRDAAESFDSWASGLSETDGFREFVDYIQTNGPRVADAMGALGNAILQIVEALAPLGGASLKIIETFADVIGAIADSDLGTPLFAGIAALSAYNRVLAVTAALQKSAFGLGVQSKGVLGGLTAGGIAKTAGVVAGLSLATSDLGDSFGATNTASGALIGAIGGPWGVAFGAAAGATLDLAKANDDVVASMDRAEAAIDSRNVDDLKASYEDLNSQISDFDSNGLKEKMSLLFEGVDSTVLQREAAAVQREIDGIAAGSVEGGDALAYLLGPTSELSAQMRTAASSVDEFAASFDNLKASWTAPGR